MKVKYSQYLFYMVFIKVNLQVQVVADEEENSKSVNYPLAIKGMVTGLLDMQIQPKGGFYEKKYVEIFGEEVKPIGQVSLDRYVKTAEEPKRAEKIIAQDGKSLLKSLRGQGPNPCFESERIDKNGLLALVCAIKQIKELNP